MRRAPPASPVGAPGGSRGVHTMTRLHLRPRYYRWHVDPGIDWVETNTGYGYLEWDIPLHQTALVLVDVWDGHYLRDTEARSEEIVQHRILPLLRASREAGMPVIHAPGPGLAEKHPAWVRLISEEERNPDPVEDWPPPEFTAKTGSYEEYAKPHEPREEELVRRRGNRRIHPSVTVQSAEPVITNGLELHRYCRKAGILFLFYAGFNTNACILLRDYGTVAMHRRGYEVIIVRDCGTGMESFETHDALLQTRAAVLFLEMFGKYSVTSEDLIEGLMHGRKRR